MHLLGGLRGGVRGPQRVISPNGPTRSSHPTSQTSLLLLPFSPKRTGNHMPWPVEDESPKSNIIPLRRGELPRGSTGEVTSFRISPEHLAQIQELVAARIDPRLKTASHVFRDAITSWLHSFHSDYSGQIPDHISRGFQRLTNAELLADELFELNFNKQFLDDLRITHNNAIISRSPLALERIRTKAYIQYDLTDVESFREEIVQIVGPREGHS